MNSALADALWDPGDAQVQAHVCVHAHTPAFRVYLADLAGGGARDSSGPLQFLRG